MKDLRVIPSSELILNEDGSIFHLHMRPEQLKNKVILVGDPARVEVIKQMFDSVECSGSNREYVWFSGSYQEKEITVLSTGIGVSNIDIVLNELDALANIDFETRSVKSELKELEIVRIGTSGAVQPEIKLGDIITSRYSIGLDSVPHFYSDLDSVSKFGMSQRFASHVTWPSIFSKPYVVAASNELVERFASFTIGGITLTAPGFYASQARSLRLKPRFDDFVENLRTFKSSEGLSILNIEMESAPIFALASMLGHKSVAVCIAIAQRNDDDVEVDYLPFMKQAIKKVLQNF